MKRPLRLYWWRHPSPARVNFGDELSALIVEMVSGRKVVQAGPRSAELVAIGSVLEHFLVVDRPSPLAVWGAGFVREGGDVVDDDHFAVHAVRGPLTAARVDHAATIGDPGLLARFLAPQRRVRQVAVGLVPHVVDEHLPFVQDASLHHEVMVISPRHPPLDVIDLISRCDIVMSSSLHGLIVADSLGIPSCWIELSDGVLGAGYKFRDHLACFGVLDPAPMRPTSVAEAIRLARESAATYDRPGIDETIAGLVAAFPF